MPEDHKISDVRMARLEQSHIPAVVRLHCHYLPYTVNSRLGKAHLAFLYEVMREDPASMVMVALVNGTVAGVVSATLDPEKLKNKIFSRMRLSDWLKLLVRLIASPGALISWYEGRQVGGSVDCQNTLVAPCLTAIAVDNTFRQAGIGRRLVAGVEEFCNINGQPAFRLDTLTDNVVSRKFYQKLGFIEAEQRGKNVMLVKWI